MGETEADYKYELDERDPFEAILVRMAQTRRDKGHDYGDQGDTYANLTAAEEFGIEPWVGCALRMNDKMQRIKAFVQKGNLKNEALEDSLLDIAVYAVIALDLRRRKINAIRNSSLDITVDDGRITSES